MGTVRLVTSIAWILISAYQYGYNISSFNSAAEAISSSVNLSTFEFGIATSAYTVGGLLASLYAGELISMSGQTKTAEKAAYAMMLGAMLVTIAHGFWVIVLGRVVIGLACGIATVVVPLHLQTVSPPVIAGKIGILCQIAINVGILSAQAISMPFSTPGTEAWRKISFISILVAGMQIITGWLVSAPTRSSASQVYDLPMPSDDEERAPFMPNSSPNSTMQPLSPPDSLSVKEVLASKDEAISKPLKALVAVMLFQQFSGINAVMFYSVTILTAVNPASAKKTALFVTVVNLIMTFPAVYLVDKLGRRSLLLISLAAMSISSAVLGYSINNDMYTVASIGILGFVVSFAGGLGPVPFVLLGEMPKEEAKSATASIAVATNWISNLAIGVFFLPLRDLLASFSSTSSSAPSSSGSGTVFYVFACVSAIGQPRQARMAGSGEKADRRTVDPPPIVRLRMRRPHARRKSVHSLTDDDFVSPSLTHTHFCFASLVPENSEEELYDLAGSRSKYVGGSCVSSLFHLKDQSCFVFPDLSVKTEGRWRFKMSLYEIVEDGVIFCDSILTEVFQVYSPKRYPGNRQSTELSKSLAEQGLKLRIRRPENNDRDDDATGSAPPRRKKSKPTPRQRSNNPKAWSATTDTAPSPASPVSGRRASGPADFTPAIPFIAPIGSTTSTPQHRPWTSWNATCSKREPPYPAAFYHGFASQEPGPFGYPQAQAARTIAHDHRRLPLLDERNTAPNPKFDPRHATNGSPTHSMPSTFSSRPQMPPPVTRLSPPNASLASFSSQSQHGRERVPPRSTTPPAILAPIRSELPHRVDRTPSLKWTDPFGPDRDEHPSKRRESNESSVRTITSDEGSGSVGVTEATSVPSSEAGAPAEEEPASAEKGTRCEGAASGRRGGPGGGGSLSMLLGEGASDAKQVDDFSFF
ncbi:hypothetical protein JCM3766R1_006983 [Sporobolomyces carnicolor]